ncbi:MAG: type II secretion system protein M [Phycisphaerae bacterium]
MSPRDRRALILGGAALGLIGLYFGVLEPAGGWYARLRRQHAAQADRIREAVNAARRLASFQDQIQEWQERTGPLVPRRGYSEQITAVGGRIIAAAGENQVQLQGATPTAPTPWPDDRRLEQALIHVDGQAEWENVFKFIAALYRIEGILSVEQLELTGEGKGGPIKLRVSVSVLMTAGQPEEIRRS